MEHNLIVEHNPNPLPPIRGRGRKKGDGGNLRLLERMGVGGTIWEVPKAKMYSIRASAFKAKIKISYRRIDERELYVIKRIT